jgi:hypothetical protein
MNMNDNAALACIIGAIAAIACCGIMFDGCGKSQKRDPIAERIQAIENLSFISREAKERLVSEALKGNTNSTEVLLEKK